MKLSERITEMRLNLENLYYEEIEALEEAAEVIKRYEDAPSGEVWQHACVAGERTSTIIITREPEDGLAVIGKRVRIVEE